jgi:hypothetical protein
MRNVRIKNVRDIKRLLNRTINQVASDELDTRQANCIGQLCNIMLRAIEMDDMENRIGELEKLISNNQNNT